MTARGVIPPAQRRRLLSAAAAAENANTKLKAAVQNAWRAGGSVRAIAGELGRSTRTIQDWLKESSPQD